MWFDLHHQSGYCNSVFSKVTSDIRISRQGYLFFLIYRVLVLNNWITGKLINYFSYRIKIFSSFLINNIWFISTGWDKTLIFTILIPGKETDDAIHLPVEQTNKLIRVISIFFEHRFIKIMGYEINEKRNLIVKRNLFYQPVRDSKQ